MIIVSTLLSSSETGVLEVDNGLPTEVSTLLSSSETRCAHHIFHTNYFRFHTTKFFWNFGKSASNIKEMVSFHTTKFFWNILLYQLQRWLFMVSTLLSSSETHITLRNTSQEYSSFHTTKFFWNFFIPHPFIIFFSVSTLLSSSETYFFTHLISHLASRFHTTKFFWNSLSANSIASHCVFPHY